jgi:hypothetical protein
VGILHHQDVIIQDGVSAEGGITTGFRRLETDPGFEPLTIGINQTDQGDRCMADECGQRRDVVIGLLGCRIENSLLSECFQPGGLSRWKVGSHGLQDRVANPVEP